MGTPQDIIRPDFQVFIKPVGPRCNLSCSYCYYLNNSELSGLSVVATMNQATLELLVKQQIEASESSIITFSWHGGEPLLAGLEFYLLAVSLQKSYCPSGKTVINGIQTNGTLIDEEWCRFFAEENFLIGLSMDGPEKFHNRHRKSKGGSGSFHRVLNAFDLLVLHGIEPEILCVVNSDNSRYPLEIYSFFRQLGITYLTFIPLVERLEGNTASPESVTPAAWGNFLCMIFDEWLARDIGKIRVQIFEETLNSALNQEHTLCIFKKQCGRVPVVEHNGNFYSCDHFVSHDHLIGNIHKTGILEMLSDASQISFGKRKSDQLPRYCSDCEVLQMCNGECPKNRFLQTPDGEKGLNYLCEGYRRFFNHCKPVVEEVRRVSLKKKLEEEV